MNSNIDLKIMEIVKDLGPRLIEKLTSLLIFAIIIVLLLSGFGSKVPESYTYLIYAVVLITLVAECYRMYRKSLATASQAPSDKEVLPKANDEVPISLYEHDSRGQLNAGAVLYVNVMEYSMFSTAEQDQVANDLLEWVSSLPMTPRTETPRKRSYWVKFGGGDLLLYIQNTARDREYAILKKAFFLALDLLDFIAAKHLRLGITLHWTEGCNYETCGSLVELWGNEIDKARRLMTFSDGGHFFLSNSAFKHLEKNLFQGVRKGQFRPIKEEGFQKVTQILENVSLSLAEGNHEFELEPLIIYDRHYRPHELFNFFVWETERNPYLGNPSRPPDWIKIEHRDKRSPDDPNQYFVKHLVEANQVSIVALTHEKTRHYLSTALKVRNNRFWDKLDIIFPSERFLCQWVEEEKSPETRRELWEEGKRTVKQFLEATGPDNTQHWNCCETDSNLTFWGNRLIKAGTKIIRMAPLLPGPDLKDLRFVTFHEGIDGYQECSDALDIMLATSLSISEWNLLGSFESGQFIYVGIAKRSRLKQLSGSFCMPVIILIIYIRTLGRAKVVIQHRTIFNAADQHGKFSNISGRLCVADTSSDPNRTAEYYKAISTALIKHKNLSADDESDLATTAFNKVSNLDGNQKKILSKEIWDQAVVREIHEELGLKLKDIKRIKYFRDHYFQGQDINHYFKIYALEISRDELQEVTTRRPNIDLHELTADELEKHWTSNQMNQFMQRHYQDIFKPILQDDLCIT